MNKFFSILLVNLMLFSVPINSFAISSNKATLKDFKELATKYNFEIGTVNRLSSQDEVVTNITKEQLEDIIINQMEQNP